MESQKVINLLDNANNQPSKFRAKSWFEVNDDAHETYNTNSQIKFWTTMLKSSLFECNDAYILVKWTIKMTGTGVDDVAWADESIIQKLQACTDYIREINNTQVHSVKYLQTFAKHF